VPITALTATATEKVRGDIVKLLGMRNERVFKTSFHRPNLVFRVVPKVERAEGDEEAPCIASLINFVRLQGAGTSGIIYCLSRNEAEGVAEYLKVEGRIAAAHYHAGMTHKQRTEVQNAWQAGRVAVIVATIAFGARARQAVCGSPAWCAQCCTVPLA
jgi:bloom syndrome protein